MGKNKFKIGAAGGSINSLSTKQPTKLGERNAGNKCNVVRDVAPVQELQPELSGTLPFRLAIQPVKAKYGGQGLAKPSIFLNISDLNFNDKFEKLFYEHIKGWAGNSYTKSRKRQEQNGMLWKKRLDEKLGSQQRSASLEEALLPKSKKRKRGQLLP